MKLILTYVILTAKRAFIVVVHTGVLCFEMIKY